MGSRAILPAQSHSSLQRHRTPLLSLHPLTALCENIAAGALWAPGVRTEPAIMLQPRSYPDRGNTSPAPSGKLGTCSWAGRSVPGPTMHRRGRPGRRRLSNVSVPAFAARGCRGLTGDLCNVLQSWRNNLQNSQAGLRICNGDFQEVSRPGLEEITGVSVHSVS